MSQKWCLLKHGGGEEKHAGKGGATPNHLVKHPLRKQQMPNRYMPQGTKKSILDVATSECASAVLEAWPENSRSWPFRGRSLWETAQSVAKAREASADAIQEIVNNAEAILGSDCEFNAVDIENANDQFRINTKDTHRADKKNQTKKKGKQI